MAINYIWLAFFIIGFAAALIQVLVGNHYYLLPTVMNGITDSAKTGFEIALGLTGAMTFWLGMMKVGEKSGLVNKLAILVSPFFSRLFPDIPKGHPAVGAILMNFSANMLGLDNAATPLGLKAMKELQSLNPIKDTASNAQIMFMALNASGLTLIPVSIMVYRAQAGAADPSDVFVPILLATFCSTIGVLILVSIIQKINLLQWQIFVPIALVSSALLAAVMWLLQHSQAYIAKASAVGGNLILILIILGFLLSGLLKKLNVFDAFIDGAKEGFETSIRIIPFLVAMLVSISVFRNSGVLTWITDGFEWLLQAANLDAAFAPALPTALLKPISGSASRGMMLDTMSTLGADAFASKIACTMQGAADTTLYILAVYFGSVNIKNTRYALGAGLFADLIGVTMAVLVGYLFFS
jgi:spore maturation protein SpmA